MFDMLQYIQNAEPGDSVVLKKMTEGRGHIIDRNVSLYFVKLNDKHEYVEVSLDQANTHVVRISLRSIQEIIRQDGTIIYKSDPRDMVYGQ